MLDKNSKIQAIFQLPGSRLLGAAQFSTAKVITDGKQLEVLVPAKEIKPREIELATKQVILGKEFIEYALDNHPDKHATKFEVRRWKTRTNISKVRSHLEKYADDFDMELLDFQIIN